ncbi:MAG: HAD-IIIA family hydrolase, partial [Nitrosomonas sp.]|nr:HAD-IIIA family hydrolase [Nitrosomonas sp.]
AIFFCPHTNADKCLCRKPATGMYTEIIQRYGVDLKNVPIIGDSLRDLQAAAAIGAKPILVLTGKGKKTSINPGIPPDTQIFDNLAAAVHALVEKV